MLDVDARMEWRYVGSIEFLTLKLCLTNIKVFKYTFILQ